MIYDTILDGAEPGANLGTAFTASISERNLIPKDKFLDHLLLSVRGAVSTAAVALETFVGLLTPLTVKAGQETRIQLRLRDLIALQAFYYGETPEMWENTDNTGQDFVFGVKIPIQETINPEQVYSYSATRVAQTNIASEELALVGGYMADAKGKKPIVATELQYTTAAATGITQLGVQVPPIGKIIGIIVFNTTIPTDAASTFSVQRLQVLLNGAVSSKLPMSVGKRIVSGVSDGLLTPINDVLKPYSFFDFREEPIDAVANAVTFAVDVQATSEAVRIIAVIEKD